MLKNRKNNFYICFLLIVFVLFTLTAFSSSANSETYNLKITTGSSGGSWFASGAVVSQFIKKAFPGSSVQVVPGGGVSNVALVGRLDSDIGFSYLPNAVAGMNGSEPYSEKYENVRAIGLMEPALSFGYATEKSGITSYRQIAEEKMPIRLGVAPVGHFAELTARRILEAYGITYEKIEEWGGKVQHLSHPEATDLFRDGHLDLYIVAAGLGHASVTEMAMAVDMVFLPTEGQQREDLNAKYGYRVAVLPRGAFEGVNEDIPIIGYSGILLTNIELEDEVVYEVAKGIYENNEDIANAYAAIGERPIKDIAKVDPIPLHPGAKKYYKELGLID